MDAERIKHIREEHHKACKLCSVSLVVLGALFAAAGMYELGLPLEIVGLYLVELV